MAELDKWQQREVQQFAKDNGVTEDEALALLHPDGVPAVAADEVAPADPPVSATE